MDNFKVNRTNRNDSRGDGRKWTLNMFDPTNPDITLFNSIDAEMIRLAGSEVTFFKYQHDDAYDKVLGEDRGKIISEAGVVIWSHYDPTPVEQNMSEFGIEMSNDQVFVFNKDYIDHKLGREPQPGDQLLAGFQDIRYEIHEVQEDSFRIYGVYHYNCYAKIMRDYDDVRKEERESTFDIDDEFTLE